MQPVDIEYALGKAMSLKRKLKGQYKKQFELSYMGWYTNDLLDDLTRATMIMFSYYSYASLVNRVGFNEEITIKEFERTDEEFNAMFGSTS